MQFLMQPWVIILAILVIVLFWAIGIYNSIIHAEQLADKAWADIAALLKYRLDLIPNLVNTIKGYAKHESSIFEHVADARARMMGAQTKEEQISADNELQKTMKSLFAVAEAYPELKANTNFEKLQQQLEDTESKIEAARRFYNTAVTAFNNTIAIIPNVIVAKMMGKTTKPLFEIENRQEAETSPKVEF